MGISREKQKEMLDEIDKATDGRLSVDMKKFEPIGDKLSESVKNELVTAVTAAQEEKISAQVAYAGVQSVLSKYLLGIYTMSSSGSKENFMSLMGDLYDEAKNSGLGEVLQ